MLSANLLDENAKKGTIPDQVQCFCKDLYTSFYSGFRKGDNPDNLKFLDGKTYCKDWWWQYLKIMAVTSAGAPCLITGLNWVTRFILKLVVPIEKKSNLVQEKGRASMLLGISLIMNTGLMLLIVNFETFGRSDWYSRVGVIIVNNMVLTIVINNGANIAFVFGFGVFRCCWERKCSKDTERTRKKT